MPMKILYICGDDPSLTSCGTQQRTHFLYEALKSIGEVTVFVPTKERRWRWWERLFNMLTKEGEWPFKREKRVRDELRIGDERFDCVVTRYMRNAARYVAWKIAPLVIDLDDAPIQAFLSLGIKRIPFGLKTFCTGLVRAWQRYVLGKCKAAWICKEEDKKFLPKGLPYGILPNLAKRAPEGFAVNGKQEKIMLSVGLMGYGPNADGVNWFVEKIWPEFYAKYPDWKYQIAGGGASETNKAKWGRDPGVEPLGFVQDLEAIYERASIVVAPINEGAGTCIKVIESALRGRATFVTPIAARGLSEQEKVSMGMRTFSSAETFIEAYEDWEREMLPCLRQTQESIRVRADDYNSFDNFKQRVEEVIYE